MYFMKLSAQAAPTELGYGMKWCGARAGIHSASFLDDAKKKKLNCNKKAKIIETK